MGKLFDRIVVQPLIRLLRVGATPEKLAWSLAVGVVVGINPLLGSTTLVVLALTGVLRLNLVAGQVGNHVAYPLELVLFPVFIKLGSMVFATPKPPLDGKKLLAAMRHHPWDTTRLLWLWEWHALVVWAVLAAAIMPVVAFSLRPMLRRMLAKLEVEVPSPS
jgi:uncharacterized protein (DUF2062 family)